MSLLEMEDFYTFLQSTFEYFIRVSEGVEKQKGKVYKSVMTSSVKAYSPRQSIILHASCEILLHVLWIEGYVLYVGSALQGNDNL